MPFLRNLKKILRTTPLYTPLKNLGAWFGYGSYALPFTKRVPAEPFLARAEARLGPLPPERPASLFYSYFSEIWEGGYEQALQQQYAAYLPFLRAAPPGPILDIGCGAGEFVAYLQAHGLHAQGIDLEAREVERARTKGLQVEQGDALAYLDTREASIAGISMLEVIEHLPPEAVRILLPKILRALMPGGVFMVETINIKHPLAFHSFYTDPTHVRPIPSDWLVFLLQWYGFVNLEIVYSNPLAYSLSAKHDPSQGYFNYAVIAHKPAVTGGAG